MKVGDLVIIKQGSRTGKLALIIKVGVKSNLYEVRVSRGCGDWFGYYRRDLEIIK